jgi:hypothetical protein
MPWKVVKRGSKYLVVNELNGHVKGTHETRKQAVQQLRALYANVPEARTKTTPARKPKGKHGVPR